MSGPGPAVELDGHPAMRAFHPVLRRWFEESFAEPTLAQQRAWPAIASGENTLLLAPTGSGKTLAAFLVALERIMFHPPPHHEAVGVRVLYISPLKALGVDVERNLQSPLAGVRAVAEREQVAYHEPRVGVRSGDTPSRERQQLNRQPPDILITTPESLYLLLTSSARRILRHVETVILDEIHSLVATKRGAHLFLTLERLEELRRQSSELAVPPLQRIGLSATQRPLEEVARLMGGAEWTMAADTRELRARPVTIVEAGRARALDLRIEVPVDDLAAVGRVEAATGPTSLGPALPSIWPAIHPRLVALIRAHRSTMIFVNSRRLAERLAKAINETADAELALAHHGSIAKDTRRQIEDRLKRGELPAIVATSSLELGIDMGAVDLVIQIEAPPTIASGIQRIGRAGHQVGGCSTGVVFPKFRGDLLACAAAARRMMAGEVEETFYARNPLDVLAQQVVAIVSQGTIELEQVFDLVRRAAPFHELPRSVFESVVDLLAGRYPSDEFAELRPRLNWDRIAGTLAPRRSSQRLAVVNAGTIPDRGLYGVFLAGPDGTSSRVGELDEEMVFETHPGDVFLLGASSWRVVEITNDRVLVAPAPGEPGRMPFWRGDGPGRPLEFGRAIGQLARRVLRLSPAQALTELQTNHRLDETAARNLCRYLSDQQAATGDVPSDRTIVVESFLDEIGDWRIAILSPFGARVHTPWSMALAARLRNQLGDEVDMMATDDGMVFRLPAAIDAPPLELLFPQPDEIEDEVVRQLGGTALFAGRFRENAARALLLPRRLPGRRTPLWMQRRRAADLLAVAAKYANFPLILETYRECLRDVFDLPGLRAILAQIQSQQIRVHTVRTEQASPFAASLLFNYTANFLYNGDTPLAERRAQTLTLDYSQLSELLGAAELRELLCPEAIDQLELELQWLDGQRIARDADGVHDALRQLGDLAPLELTARLTGPGTSSEQLEQWLTQLQTDRRILSVRIAGESRYIAVEDAARWRDVLGVVLPPGLPAAFLERADEPLLDLVARYARSHVPFTAEQVASRLGLGVGTVQLALDRLVAAGRVLVGEFLPGRRGREWTDPQVLRQLKRRSLARLRKQVEPVEQAALGRFLPIWQHVHEPRRGLNGLLDVIEQLQGAALPMSAWEDEVLARRVADYRPADLDELCAAGEIVWRGCDSLGADDGRIALYLTEHASRLAPDPVAVDHELAESIERMLQERGALFFEELTRGLGAFSQDVLDGLWQLVWSGRVTNDTLAPLRSRRKPKPGQRSSQRPRGGRFRSRRATAIPGSEGRWSLFEPTRLAPLDETTRQFARVTQLIERYGIVTREIVASEGMRGGFAGVYPVLKAMEEAGKLRRGYFVAGLGAAQFAAPGADDRLRQLRQPPVDETTAAEPILLAATDPANPYGAALPWPSPREPDSARLQRAAGTRVVMWRGHLIGYLGRSGQQLTTFEIATESQVTDQLARALADDAQRAPILLATIDGQPAIRCHCTETFQRMGFVAIASGLLHRGSRAEHR